MNDQRLPHRSAVAAMAVAAMAGLLAACATAPSGDRTATIERTTHGVAHITAPDLETAAYGVAYAHAQDNVCQTAQQLVTVRGERSLHFGPSALGLLGLRPLPNEQADFFIAAHMNDAVLDAAWARNSADTQAMARGYVAGYNRFLADRASQLPAACNGQAWVKPMTAAEYRRLAELSSVQAGVALLADAMLAAKPPTAGAAGMTPAFNLADAAEAMRVSGLLDSPFGSNAWAFGRETTANGSGLLLGNPHFPWAGTNRFWQLHVKVPGQLDVMGASLGQTAIVQIGFNKDVAWSHTVSTGKRFTLHELALAPNDPTSYLLDGQPQKMQQRPLTIRIKGADGTVTSKSTTVWATRWGPVIVNPRAGLNWTTKTAYALKDANTGNARSSDTWLAMNRARSAEELRAALGNLGTPWVNTIAADRQGNAFYADLSVVPDVDAAQLERCAPSAPAKALLRAAGLVVLNGSRSDCDWKQDPASPVPGLTPPARLPVIVRGDWVQNSNDSFVYTHPAAKVPGISPLVGDGSVQRVRTRSSWFEIPLLLADGKVTLPSVQKQLFGNRNYMGQAVVPDLLVACTLQAPAAPEARDGCAALRAWDRTSEAGSRGAHLFREFWRTARAIPAVHRTAFDPAEPMAGPIGLKMDDAVVAGKVWDALAGAVKKVRDAGFALDAPLASVQRPAITQEVIGLHGGDEIEGVLNNLGDRGAPGIGKNGIRIDYGTSYVQSVTFDARGPVARALLTYGQSTEPASPHTTDQMKLYAQKTWPVLPFHAEDVARARLGEPFRLTRP
jgi:acyl-homoserine-lactone acylase